MYFIIALILAGLAYFYYRYTHKKGLQQNLNKYPLGYLKGGDTVKDVKGIHYAFIGYADEGYLASVRSVQGMEWLVPTSSLYLVKRAKPKVVVIDDYSDFMDKALETPTTPRKPTVNHQKERSKEKELDRRRKRNRIAKKSRQANRKK